MSIHIDGQDICMMATIIWAICLQSKLIIVDGAFIKLFKEKYGRLPTEWKDYRWK